MAAENAGIGGQYTNKIVTFCPILSAVLKLNWYFGAVRLQLFFVLT